MSSKFNYKLTPLAVQDIYSTLAYIDERLCNAKAACELYLKIEETIGHICSYPYSCADCGIYLISDENIRHVFIDHYVLIYEVKKEEKQINILRFRYAKMNLANVPLDDDK